MNRRSFLSSIGTLAVAVAAGRQLLKIDESLEPADPEAFITCFEIKSVPLTNGAPHFGDYHGMTVRELASLAGDQRMRVIELFGTHSPRIMDVVRGNA